MPNYLSKVANVNVVDERGAPAFIFKFELLFFLKVNIKLSFSFYFVAMLI